jgi:hypothetical protein
LAAAVIDRQYQWVVTLEPLIAVEVDELPVVPKKIVDRFRVRGFVEGDSSAQTLRERSSEGFGDRSNMVQGK